MATVKPEWELSRDAEQLVSKLKEKYPTKFGHITVDQVGCAMITNKDKPDSQEWIAKITGVVDPVTIYCSKKYIIQFYRSSWDALTPAQKSAVIFQQMCKIPDDPDGKLNTEDLKDIKCMVKSLGVDYINRLDLPDLALDEVSI